MRSIIKEDAEQQIQSDENGREYIYRKDFVAGGDMKNEFSPALIFSRTGRIVPVEGSGRICVLDP